MSTINCKEKITEEAVKTAHAIINWHDKYKGTYFWTPAFNANGRRANETRFENNKPEAIFHTSFGVVEAIFEYSESCRNVYYSACFSLDGIKKDIRIIKKILK